jgi:phage shock protein E
VKPRTHPLLLAAALAAALLACGRQVAGDGTISQSALLDALHSSAPPLVLDVRTPEEYAGGHVPGAMNIPYDQLPGRLDEVQASHDDEVVVYCETGRRAAKAQETLRGAGFSRVIHLDGDMAAWRASRQPTEP